MSDIESYDHLVKASNLLPKRHPINLGKTELNPQPLFIIGSGRNGSTMLGSMLNMHPEILLVPEQFALVYSIVRYKLLNFLNWNDLVKIVVGEFARPKGTLWKTDLSEAFDTLHNLPKEQRSLAKILDVVYREYGVKNGIPFTIWGDKTPKNTLHYEKLHEVFPNAKYVFLIRDGRDVISSYAKAEKKHMAEHSDPENALKIWNTSIEAHDHLKSKCDPTDLHVMRYEDLVTDSSSTLKKLCEFLGLEFSEEMLNFQKESDRMGVSNMAHHANVAKEVSAGSVGKWKTGLSNQQKESLIPLIRENLDRWGYL